jgi:hypothetical protein
VAIRLRAPSSLRATGPITRSEYFRDDDFSWALAIVDEFTELQ